MRNGSEIKVRAIRPGDRPFLAQCAPFIQARYPGGADWLDRRLDSVLGGCGRGLLATVDGYPAGFAISTEKGERIEKLSSLFVHPSMRGLGCGRRLIGALSDLWHANDVHDAYVTCAAGDRATEHFFKRHGFVPVAVVQDRYGPGRDETVLSAALPPAESADAAARQPGILH